MSTCRLMTLNLRASASPGDAENAWEVRWPHVKALINDLMPNVLGAQECMPNQLVNIMGEVPGFFAYPGPETTLTNYWSVRNPFFVCQPCTLPRAESALALNESGVIGQISWDGRESRLAHILRFEDWVLVNTHFENADSPRAQVESARLLAEYLQENPAAVIMGSLNCAPDSAPIGVLRAAGFALAKDALPPEVDRRTYHGFTGRGVAELDYILYRGVKLLDVQIPRPRREAPFLSDHDPIVVEIEIEE
ncbi:MAG: hypothetical protein Kow0077_23470 [Anaerolineae bacterium]